MQLKISDLAKRSGLTVRALHHYDAIGLLSPSARTQAGARQYGQQDLIRLHRIQALKALGHALPAIRINLDDPSIKPLEMMTMYQQPLTDEETVALRTPKRRALRCSPSNCPPPRRMHCGIGNWLVKS